jgi:molybdopterin-synthase adenylyltransferase
MSQTPLNAEEIERYGRHIVLPEIGGAGQQRLKAARVAVVGAGGLGSPALLYLAAAGVGQLTIIDNDTVALSNLQRQIIHGQDKIGHAKTDSAAAAIGAINPHVRCALKQVRLTADNAALLLDGHDVVLDGSDNFGTRYLVADTCEKLAIALVVGALGRFDGSLTVIAPHKALADGTQAPRYRDIFPNPPKPGTVPNCAQAGILGAVAGVIGTLQAVEAIKLICWVGEPLLGRLLLFDGLSMRFETIRVKATGTA